MFYVCVCWFLILFHFQKKKRSSWVQCDEEHCQKWRRIDHMSDLAAVETDKWVCSMNDGMDFNSLLENIWVYMQI